MRWGILQLVALSSSLWLAECSSDPCVSVIDPGMVVRDATGLRVDVYDDPVTCANLLTTPGAAMSSSRLFSPNDSITIQVAPGKHAVVLTTFSDPALTNASGRGCADVAASAGVRQCLSVTITPLSGGGLLDGGLPGDLALPSTYSGLPTCGNFCDCKTGTCSLGSCGPGCHATCSGNATCTYNGLAQGTLLSCEGTALCTAQCDASCALQCGSMAACRLQCPGEASAHFVTGVATCP